MHRSTLYATRFAGGAIAATLLLSASPAAAQLISIDATLIDIDARVTIATGRIALIEGRLVRVDADLAGLVTAGVELNARVDALGGTIAEIGGRVDANGRAIAAIDGRVGRVEGDVATALANDARQDAQLADHSARIGSAAALAMLARDEAVTLRADLDAGRAGMVRQNAQTGTISIGGQSGGTLVDFAGTDGDRRLTGIADGIAPNDAATMGQIDRLATATLDASRAYTDQSVARMFQDSVGAAAGMIADNNRLLQADMNALAANGAALSGLPQSFIPGRGMAGMAMGGHGGELAFALGLSKAFDGDHVPVVRAGAAMDTRRGRVTYNASVGIHF